MSLKRYGSVRETRSGSRAEDRSRSSDRHQGEHAASARHFTSGPRWAWPPPRDVGPCGGSLSALDLLDRSEREPDGGWPQTEAELANMYQSNIAETQQRHLEPLREDLADWLNKILGECRLILSRRSSIATSCFLKCRIISSAIHSFTSLSLHLSALALFFTLKEKHAAGAS